MRKIALIALFGIFICGCASYRYEIADPQGQARVVRKDADLVIPALPAEIRARQVESRCVIMIRNPTTQPISLDSAQSTLVDPDGQIHPIAGQLIPPGAYGKLILPPMREVSPRGPEFRIGFGLQVRADIGDSSRNSDKASHSHANSVQKDSSVQQKSLYLMYGEADNAYWEWKGEGSARLILGLVQNEQTFRHEFIIRRIKE